MKTNTSKYNTRVTIQKPVDGVGDMGHPEIASWTKVCDRWAMIAATNGREYQQALAIVADLAAVVRLRWDSLTSQITPRMRLVLGSRVWNIASATNDAERNREIVLYCTEVVA